MINLINSPTHRLQNLFFWLKDIWHLAYPYWTSNKKLKALIFLITIIGLNLLTIYINVAINKWYNSFYSSLQNYAVGTIYHLLIRFTILAIFYITFKVLADLLLKLLTIDWREWATEYYINQWLDHKGYYLSSLVNQEIADNPDQRISEDVNAFIVLFFDLTLGLLNSIVTLISFSYILWSIGGSLNLHWHNVSINIPGYLIWVAIIYSLSGTWLIFKIGQPLIKLDFYQQALEANFRSSLMHVRNNAENIASFNGELLEKVHLKYKFSKVVINYLIITYRTLKIGIFATSFAQIANIFPLIVSLPQYFNKSIKLGDLIQILPAFEAVNDSLAYFLNSYVSWSGWRAVMNRLLGLEANLAQAKQLFMATKVSSFCNYAVQISNLTIYTPDNKKLLTNFNLNLVSGDKLLIKGSAGSGKTTFLRSVAGLWPFIHGNITFFNNTVSTKLFVPQRPYMPLVSLFQAIYYPSINYKLTKNELHEILHKCGISYLIPKLNLSEDWGKVLSIGEQQKISFARILIHRPQILILDEVTSAIDEEMENQLYYLLTEELPNSTILSVAHRSSLNKWHNKFMNFNDL